jgi:predicted negative regulator of RcsB-dependent stress response
MKTERRHDLETNALAGYLGKFIQQVQPYLTVILVGVVVVVGLFALLFYLQKSTTSQQREAWNAYNLAIEQPRVDLDVLKQAAEQNAGDPMANWANITWADGQLFQATQRFIQFRSTADENLKKAESAYQSLLNSSADPTVKNRANFGLGRVYEMRNQIDAARQHYLAVKGGFSELAEDRIKILEQKRTLRTIEWLAKAEPPPLPALGEINPGAGGLTPPFKVDEFGATDDAADDQSLLGDIIKGFGKSEDQDNGDRYDGTSDTETDAKPKTPAEKTPAEKTPAEKTPAEKTPAEKTPAEATPAEATPAVKTPGTEKPTDTQASSTSDTAAEAKAGETPPNQ